MHHTSPSIIIIIIRFLFYYYYYYKFKKEKKKRIIIIIIPFGEASNIRGRETLVDVANVPARAPKETVPTTFERIKV